MVEQKLVLKMTSLEGTLPALLEFPLDQESGKLPKPLQLGREIVLENEKSACLSGGRPGLQGEITFWVAKAGVFWRMLPNLKMLANIAQ